MIKRLTAVAGFLAAASLLSGSAFAFAPEFDQDLPTVVITDKLPSGTLSEPYDVNGQPSDTTGYVFRFSDAFALLDYVDSGDNDPAQLKYVFNEFDYPQPGVNPNDRSQGTLLINGNRAYASGTDQIPDGPDVETSGFLVQERYNDGGLDFRNRDFSGDDESVNAGFDEIGDVTGYDIELSGAQQRLVQLYLKGDTSDEINFADMLVITTREGEDRLESPVFTTPWERLLDDDILDGWLGGGSGPLAFWNEGDTGLDQILGDTDVSNYSASPGSPAPAGSDTLSVSTTNEIGFYSWAMEADLFPVNPLQANTLYRLRANIYSPDTNTNEAFRLTFGNSAPTGLSTVQYNNTASAVGTPPQMPSATDNELDVYLYTEAEGAPKATADIITQDEGGQDFVLDSVIIDGMKEAGFGGLGTATQTVASYGAAVSSQVSDETSVPASSPTAIAEGTTVGDSWVFNENNGTPGGAQSTSESWSGGTFTLNMGVESATVAPPYLGSLALNGGSLLDPTVTGAFQVSDGKIYVVDVWASTSTSRTEKLTYPDLRINVPMAATYNAYTLHDVAPVAAATDAANPIALTSTPRAYTLVFEPQTGFGANEATVSVEFLSFGKNYDSASDITIHQIVVREYDMPADP